ncbi:MAG: RNA polymerase sigma factor [Sandaracinaceae bacterium]
MVEQHQGGRSREDVALLQAALAGQPEAAHALVERLHPTIYRRVDRQLRRRGANLRGAVEDLVQHVWEVLLRRDGHVLRAYDPARGASLLTYVGLVAEREVGNELARRRTQKAGGGRVVEDQDEVERSPSPAPSPERDAETADMLEKLAAHLEERLPPKGLLIFRYLYTDGLSPRRAAEILEVTVQVVYNWQHRIRQEARAFLAALDA